jgi:hypothetical protein
MGYPVPLGRITGDEDGRRHARGCAVGVDGRGVHRAGRGSGAGGGNGRAGRSLNRVAAVSFSSGSRGDSAGLDGAADCDRAGLDRADNGDRAAHHGTAGDTELGRVWPLLALAHRRSAKKRTLVLASDIVDQLDTVAGGASASFKTGGDVPGVGTVVLDGAHDS